MNVKQALILLFTSMFVAVEVLAQRPGFVVKELGKNEGLEHNTNNAFISTDSRGFHWIGSNNGCYRFDGTSLTYFSLESELKIQSIVQSEFFEDKEGNIWFSTINGLLKYDYQSDAITGTNLEVKFPELALGYHLFHLEKGNGVLWLANSEQIVRINIYDETITYPLIKTASIRFEVLEKGDGELLILGFPWLLGKGMELIRVKDEQVTLHQQSADPAIQARRIGSALIEESSVAWLTTDDGLIRYDIGQDSVSGVYKMPGLSDQRLWSIVAYGADLLISTQANGIWVFNPAKSSFLGTMKELYAMGGTSPSTKLRTLEKGDTGILLAMKIEGGINLFIPKSTVFQEVKENDNPIAADGILADKAGRIWLAQTSGKISVLDTNKQLLAISTELSEVSQGYRIFLTEKNDGGVIVSKGTSLFETKLTDDHSLVLKQISTLKNQAIEILTIDNEIYSFNFQDFSYIKEGKEVSISTTKLGKKQISAVSTTEDQHFLIATNEKKLYIAEVVAEKIQLIDSITVSQPISTSYQKNKDEILVGTTNGILRFKKSGSSWVSDSLKLPNTLILNFRHDDNNVVWAATNKGLAKEVEKNNWKIYDSTYGLKSDQITLNTLAASSSTVWIATDLGVATFPNLSGNDPAQQGKIYITDYWINDRKKENSTIEDEDTLSLTYQENTLDFGLGTVGIYDNSKIKFRHQLIGYENTWAELKNGSNIRYTQIPPGKYTLLLEARNELNELIDSFKIVIILDPPFWKTWWFRTLMFLTIVSSIALIIHINYKRQLQVQKEKIEKERLLNQERERIGKELHDDLGGDLASILYLSENMDPELLEANRKRIIELSSSSLESMRDYIWVLDSEENTLESLLLYIESKIQQNCLDRGITFELESSVSKHLLATQVSSTFRRSVYMIVKESVNNAIKHGKATSISLALHTTTDSFLQIRVADNGQGFNSVAYNTGNGIGNMKSRAKDLEGSLQLNSELGKGTEVLVIVPLPTVS